MKKPLKAPDEPSLIAYYCRQCEKVVKAIAKGKTHKYTFLCPTCSRECFYGTANSVINYMRIKEGSENAQILLQFQQEKLGEKMISG